MKMKTTLGIYNDSNHLIYRKSKNNTEVWFTLDKDNRRTHITVKFPNGETIIGSYYYDKKGRNFHFSSNDGYEKHRTYNDNENRVVITDTNGVEEIVEYNEHIQFIYHKEHDGFEHWWKYEPCITQVKTSLEKDRWITIFKKENDISYKALSYTTPFCKDVLTRVEFNERGLVRVYSNICERTSNPIVIVEKKYTFNNRLITPTNIPEIKF